VGNFVLTDVKNADTFPDPLDLRTPPEAFSKKDSVLGKLDRYDLRGVTLPIRCGGSMTDLDQTGR